MSNNFDFTNIALIEPKPFQWLWPNHIPLGALTLIAGHPGVGKSLLAADITARATTNHPWPGEPSKLAENFGNDHTSRDDIRPARAIYLAANEDLAATLYPRLSAAGADLERVIAASVTPQLDDTIDQLEALLSHLVNARLVILDPLAAYLRHLEASRGQRAREVLETLVDLAKRYEIALVGLTHQSRSGRGPSISRLTSSVALTAAARAVWTIKPDRSNPRQRFFLPTKNNFASDQLGRPFQISSAKDQPEVATIIWNAEPVEAKSTRSSRPTRNLSEDPTDAEAWLTAKLKTGPRAAGQLKSEASHDGFTWKTIQRAKSRLNVQSQLIADPQTLAESWHWLPPQHKPEHPTS